MVCTSHGRGPVRNELDKLTVLYGFEMCRNNEVENVSKNIQYDKMNVMFIAETMHDSESTSLSKLRSRGQKSGSDFQLNISRMLSNLTSTVFLKHLCVGMNSNFKSVIGCLSHWKCVFIVESQKLRNKPIEGKALACYKSCYVQRKDQTLQWKLLVKNETKFFLKKAKARSESLFIIFNLNLFYYYL